MSSFRSYSKSYSSRDDLTSTKPRFGSFSSSTTYRPTYTGGTYKCSGLKREPSTSANSYIGRISSLAKSTDNIEKDSTKQHITSTGLKTGLNRDTASTAADSKSTSSRFPSTSSLALKTKIKDASTPEQRTSIVPPKVRSRDSSLPCSKTNYKSRESTSSDSIKESSYVPSFSKYGRTLNSSYGSKFGMASRASSVGPAISYMNISESTARCVQRRTEKEAKPVKSTPSVSDSVQQKVSNEASDSKSQAETPSKVYVVTRSTSPTPPNSSGYSRYRRPDVAKAVEKTVRRATTNVEYKDKEVQSDRCDESPKYIRYNSPSSAPIPWSSNIEPKYTSTSNTNGFTRLSRNNSVSSSPTRYALNANENSSSESPEKSPQKSPSKSRESSVSKSSSLSQSSNSKSEKVFKSSPSPSQRSHQPITKQRSGSNKSLPPLAPKADSPIKNVSSSSSSISSPFYAKWTNKDFRKSALNVGPTDRPRKSRHSSLDSEESNKESETHSNKSGSPSQQRVDRSPSVSSDVSCSSNTTNSASDEISKNLMKLKISRKPSLTKEVPKEQIKTEKKEKSKSDVNKSSSSIGPVTQIFKTNSKNSSDEYSFQYSDINQNDNVNKSGRLESPLLHSNSDKIIHTEPIYCQTYGNSSTNNDKTTTDMDTWMNNSTLNSNDSVANQTFSIANSNESVKNRLRHIDSGELPWWMTENEDTVVDDITLNQSESENGFSMPDGNSNSASLIQDNRSIWFDDTNTEKLDTTDSSKPTYRISHIRSGERAWWMSSPDNTNELETHNETDKSESYRNFAFKIRRFESEERDWWCSDDGNAVETEEISKITKNADFIDNKMPIGDRASPEGLEDAVNNDNGRSSPYDNVRTDDIRSKKLFISQHTNIDELLGGTHTLNPMLLTHFDDGSNVRDYDNTKSQYAGYNRDNWDYMKNQPISKLDDATIQVYKDGDYGAYLDLESSLAEQSEEIEGLHSNSRKNSLVVRTQLSVRVHAIIEKLLTSEGRELRRTLFSLKQIFQDDKDLVHAFVALGGLNSLILVGNDADQNYQNYILRALGQVMLYVDGMNGIMEHGATIQWLYSLIASKYRLVVKTALKLLLVFVEYVESNCYLLINAIHAVDSAHETLPWSNIMNLLKDYEKADTELLIYATSLINKTLSGLSEQDSFYDESDYLEQQGMEGVIQRYMSRPGTDLDLLDQLQLYEAVLKFEDGETDRLCILDSSVRKTLRCRSINANSAEQSERRKSRRHSTGNTSLSQHSVIAQMSNSPIHQTVDEDSSGSANSGKSNEMFGITRIGFPHENAGVTPGLRRRRERAERQKSFMREQQKQAVPAVLQLFNAKDDANNHDLIVKAVPCRLQNESPTIPSDESISNDKDNSFKPIACNYHDHTFINDSHYNTTRCLGSQTKLESHAERKESESSADSYISSGTDTTNDNDTKSNTILNNLLNANAKELPKPAIPMANQKNLNCINNIHNNLNHSKNINDTISGTFANINQNGLPTPSSVGVPVSPSPCDKMPASLAKQTNNYVNRNINRNADSSKQYVIQNRNGIIVNGNSDKESIKLEPKDSDNEEKKLLLQLKRDHTVKDLTQKLSNLPISSQEEKVAPRIGDMTGLISKAKEGLAKSKSKADIARSPSKDQEVKKAEPKKSENELHWEELKKNMTRPLMLCDLDFTDLLTEDDNDNSTPRGVGGCVPPPPPPLKIAPPPFMKPAPPPAMMHLNMDINGKQSNGVKSIDSNGVNSSIKKNKKTVKLFWKEVREDLIPVTVGKTIWDELPSAVIDTQKLEHLFESRAKELTAKRQQELNKNKEIIVLDHKRSNAINIAMTKLPPPRAIKAAILKMDATVVTREGIDKLLNMLPTEEERGKIQEAQMVNPELPLGSAEQFLLTLSSISELAARLKLWAFKLDFENSEKEIAEPLMDLKQGLEVLKNNKTFKCILSTLLSIGIFLNGTPVKGFQIEYLSKVPEVKDTVNKHSLLHHLCHIVIESSSDTTDLYSEIGSVTRASKADFADLAHNIGYLETECKASWDRLKLIAKHDCPPQLKQKLVDFLADCAERIIILEVVHRRVINRYRKFLLWLGVPQHRVHQIHPNEICRIISEFALEYRTTRERVHQQMEKKASHRERNKTRGKMIIDIGKFRSQDDRADTELKQLLEAQSVSAEIVDGNRNYTWRRRRPEILRSPSIKPNEEGFTDGDDEILESLVKTATKASTPRTMPRERKRTRNADRKSLRRTLKNGLTEEEKQHVATFIKRY